MKISRNKFFAMLLAVLFICTALPCAAETHPASILQADPIEDFTETEDRFTNILLLGIDNGFPGFWGSARKRSGDIEECHADAFIIVSINMTTAEANLISIPRDTVTYVPGVRGLYKLNATVNCGETFEEGLEYAMQAASWHLGGVKIDYFACLDMGAMIALGDCIGGVDLDLEMSYQATYRYYHKGMQHLDGQGMMDYARSRKLATVNPNDLGRTSRQRQVVMAIMEKLRDNPNLIKKAWNYATGGEINFYTNLKLGTVLNLANKAASTETIGNYVLAGPITRVMDWNFTITDPDTRREVIKTVFGIDAEDLPYVSEEYLSWMENNAINCIHCINLGKDILAQGRSQKNLSEKQVRMLDDLEASIGKVTEQFFISGDRGEKFTKETELYSAMTELRDQGEAVKASIGYTDTPGWRYTMRWNTDPLINQYQLNWG